jgi:molybdenum cofactor cytidylyltransferase
VDHSGAVRANEHAIVKAAAVLLAAGLSRRMGERNKLLIEIAGVPLVRRTAEVYLAAGIPVHAVLGHEAERVRAALDGLPLTFVTNPRYEEGQQSSVLAGVESLGADWDAVLIALSDQVALRPGDLRELLAAFARCGGKRIVVPFYKSQRGNPVVFPAKLIRDMRSQGTNAASRAFIDANPRLMEQYEAAHDRFIIDIDTPDDLKASGEWIMRDARE